MIVGAHDTGPLIRSNNGFWLAILTPAAGKSTLGGCITPGERERRTGLRLRFVYRRSGPSLLVAERRVNTKGRAVASRSKTGRGVVTAPIFLLVPQITLPKRLDLARDAERLADGVPGLIVANWVEVRLRDTMLRVSSGRFTSRRMKPGKIRHDLFFLTVTVVAVIRINRWHDERHHCQDGQQ